MRAFACALLLVAAPVGADLSLTPHRAGSDRPDVCRGVFERARGDLLEEDDGFDGAAVVVERAVLGGRAVGNPTDRVTLTAAGGRYFARVEYGVNPRQWKWLGYRGTSAAYLWRGGDRAEGLIEVTRGDPERGPRFVDRMRRAVDDCLGDLQ